MEEKKQTEIQRFVFPVTQQAVRVFMIDGEPWWVARDVCEVLGYSGNVANRVKDHCRPKGVRKQNTLTKGGMQAVTVVDEHNLYRMVGRSDAPNAVPFQDWLFGEVLPAIRKTGGYGNSVPFDPTDPQQLLTLLQSYATKQIELSKKIEQDAPKVAAIERLESADGSMCPTHAAKVLSVRPCELFEFFRHNRWAYRPNGVWIAYQNKIQAGLLDHTYFEIKRPDGSTSVRTQMHVTPKGIAKLAKLLNSPPPEQAAE